MNDMTKTKCTFIIKVACPYCSVEMTLPSITFIYENIVNIQCRKCFSWFLAKNKFGGVGGENENNN